MATTLPDFVAIISSYTAALVAGTITESEYNDQMLTAYQEWLYMGITNQQISASLANNQTMVNRWGTELSDWAVGTEDGGPDSDGYYPFTDERGVVHKIPSIAKMRLDLEGDIALAEGWAADAEAAKIAAQGSATAANTSKVDAEAAKVAAEDAADRAEAATGVSVTAVKYFANWNAATNFPVLPTPSPATQGNFYLVTVPGNTNISGITKWGLNDWVVDMGGFYAKVDNQDYSSSGGGSAPVLSVNGKTGIVTINKTDVGLSNVDNTSDANKPISTAVQAALDLKAGVSTVTGLASIVYVDAGLGGKANTVHTHVMADITDLAAAMAAKQDLLPSQVGNSGKFLTTNGTTLSWGTPSGGGGSGGDMYKADNLSGLANNATARANLGVNWTNLDGKPSTFTPSAHTHVIADVTGLQTALDLKVTIAGQTGIGGFTSTTVDDGIKSSGTYTPSPLTSNFRKIQNNGAFTFAAPTQSGSYSMTVDVTNGGSAGTITFTGFATGHPRGDTLDTTSGHSFKIHINKSDAGITATIERVV